MDRNPRKETQNDIVDDVLVRLLALAIAGLLVVPGALIAANDARAETITVPARLPAPTWDTSAVWDGTNAYVFGGAVGGFNRDAIVRYDPSTNTAVNLTVTLPTARCCTSAVWDGANAYIFGGAGWDPACSCENALDQIVRYNPSTNTVTNMSATLPTGRYHTSAVWDGTNAYIFGGYDGVYHGEPPDYTHYNQIVRYNPSTDTVTVMNAHLPTDRGRSQTSAVWDGTNAYIFGGDNNDPFGFSPYWNQVVRYNPGTDTVTVMNAILPTPRYATSAAWDGTNAYIFGGYGWVDSDHWGRYDEIVRYNPSTDTIAIMGAKLPDGRTDTSAAWGDGAAYVFGGYGDETDEIVRYDPATPDPPRSLAAVAGPGLGQIALSWSAPASDGGHPITDYKVYRGTAPGGETYLTHTGSGSVLTLQDSGLGNGATRYYRVTAVNSRGESEPSNEASARTFAAPGAPVGLTATPGAGKVTLRWLSPDDGGAPIASFAIYRGSQAGGPYARLDARAGAPSGTTVTYDDPTCAVGLTCRYVVSAINIVGEGPVSNEASSPGTAPGLLGEDFSTGAPSWTLSGLWHVQNSGGTPSCRFLSPPNSLAYNIVDCPPPPSHASFNVGVTSGDAVSPPFIIPAGTYSRVVLNYGDWHDTEESMRFGQWVDVKRVDVKRSSDPTWTNLLEEHGARSVWALRSVDIPPAFAGATLQLRFHFDSVDDQGNGGEGWYVDDVHVVGVP